MNRFTKPVVLFRSAAVIAGVALLAGCASGSPGPSAGTVSLAPSTDSAVLSGGSAADRTDSATEEANETAVERLYTDVFPDPGSDSAVSAAGELIAPDAVAHGSGLADGPEGVLEQFTAAHDRIPGAQAVVKRVAADGDLVAVHWQLTADSSDERTGEAVIDLFRVTDGQVAERWSLVQPVPTGTPASGNTNTMFSDLYAGGADAGPLSEEQEEANRTLAVGAYDTLFRDQDVAVLDEAFDPAYLQHNAVAPNGTEALKNLFSGSASFPAQESVVSLADGDLVWTFSQSVGAEADAPILAADIFRVDDGLIREHWDVVPAAPAS